MLNTDGQKYEYQQNGPVPVGNVMEVPRIRCNQGQSTSRRVLLRKTTASAEDIMSTSLPSMVLSVSELICIHYICIAAMLIQF